VVRSTSVLCLALAACGEDSRISWEITGTGDAYTVEVEVRRGGCSGSEVEYISRGPVASWMPTAVPALGRGTWGFAADAVDDECRHIGFGCTEVALPSPTSVVVTEIEPMAPLDLCPDELCLNGTCAGRRDAGVLRMDAGPIVLPDAGAPDAGTDAGRSDCERYPEAALCETFDSPLEARGWVTLGEAARLSLVPMSRSGLALEAEAGIGGWGAVQAEFDTERFTAGDRFFVRWYGYIDGPDAKFVPGGTFTAIALSSDMNPTDGPQVRFARSRFELDSPGTAGIAAGLPFDTWFCAELEILLDPMMGVVALHVDGGPARMIGGVQTLPTGGDVEMVLVGMYSPTGSAQGRMLFDELVVSRSAIGCD
jgi:hypothetical protein